MECVGELRKSYSSVDGGGDEDEDGVEGYDGCCSDSPSDGIPRISSTTIKMSRRSRNRPFN